MKKEWQYGKVRARNWDHGDLIAYGTSMTSDSWEDWYDPSINNNEPIPSRYLEGDMDGIIQIQINGNWYYTQNIDWE